MTPSMPVRVRVADAWDEVPLELPATTPLGEVKRLALQATRQIGDPAGYVIKFRGAELLDESRSLSEAGLVANGALIVLRKRRAPVR
ncbi:MAG TPA: EsaB/YukD family protein [Gemmatimonadales bacterium]|nr:EsaB/YukD family protein [Gemmatimonadales bacterium]